MSRRLQARRPHAVWLLGEAGPFLVLALFVVVSAAQAAALLHWPVLSSRPGSIALLALAIVVGALGTTWRRAREAAPASSESAGSLALCSLPALLVLATAGVMATKPLPGQVGWFLMGDHVRHLVFVAQERAEGYLAYGSNAYPRAWHTLLASVWTAAGGQPDIDGLLVLVPLMANAVWVLYAVLSLTTALSARALATRSGLGSWQAGMAGLIAGAVTLWPTFLSNYLILGFQNSVLASVLIAVVAREVLERPDSPRALLLAGMATALMAHVWQLLLPAVVVPLAYVTWTQRRSIRARPVAFAAFTLLCLGVATPGLVAVLTRVGLPSARGAGVVAELPIVFLPLSLVATGVVVWRHRRDRPVVAYGAVVAGTVVAALGVAAALGIPAWQYYPSKMLWSAGVLALAALGVSVAVLVSALWSTRAGAPGRVVAVFGVGLLLALCSLNLTVPLRGGWVQLTPSRILDALSTPGAATAQVVWLPDDDPVAGMGDALISRILLDYFRAKPGLPLVQQSDLSMDQSCALLRQHGGWVLSDQPREAVEAHYACAPGVKVLPVVDRFGENPRGTGQGTALR